MKHEIRTSRWYRDGFKAGKRHRRGTEQVYLPYGIREALAEGQAVATYLRAYADGVDEAMRAEFFPPENEGEDTFVHVSATGGGEPNSEDNPPSVAEVTEFYE